MPSCSPGAPSTSPTRRRSGPSSRRCAPRCGRGPTTTSEPCSRSGWNGCPRPAATARRCGCSTSCTRRSPSSPSCARCCWWSRTCTGPTGPPATWSPTSSPSSPTSRCWWWPPTATTRPARSPDLVVALAELRRHQKVTALELAPLPRDVLAELVAEWAPGRSDLEELVWQRSGGQRVHRRGDGARGARRRRPRPADHPARGRAEPHRGALGRRAAGGAGDRGRASARCATSCWPTCSTCPPPTLLDAMREAVAHGVVVRRRERRRLPAAARPDDRGRGGRPAAGRADRPAPAVRAGAAASRIHAARPGRAARPPLVRGGRRGAGAGRDGGGGVGVRRGARATPRPTGTGCGRPSCGRAWPATPPGRGVPGPGGPGGRVRGRPRPGRAAARPAPRPTPRPDGMAAALLHARKGSALARRGPGHRGGAELRVAAALLPASGAEAERAQVLAAHSARSAAVAGVRGRAHGRAAGVGAGPCGGRAHGRGAGPGRARASASPTSRTRPRAPPPSTRPWSWRRARASRRPSVEAHLRRAELLAGPLNQLEEGIAYARKGVERMRALGLARTAGRRAAHLRRQRAVPAGASGTEAQQAVAEAWKLRPSGAAALDVRLARCRIDIGRGDLDAAAADLEAVELLARATTGPRQRIPLLVLFSALALWRRQPRGGAGARRGRVHRGRGGRGRHLGGGAAGVARRRARGPTSSTSGHAPPSQAQVERVRHHCAELARRGSGTVPAVRSSIEAFSLMCAAEMDRAEQATDPDAWERAADTWERLPAPLPVRLRPDAAGRGAAVRRPRSTQAAEVLRRADGMARALGARPLLEDIADLAGRARITARDAAPPRRPTGARRRSTCSPRASWRCCTRSPTASPTRRSASGSTSARRRWACTSPGSSPRSACTAGCRPAPCCTAQTAHP